jgi:hypothetical protein
MMSVIRRRIEAPTNLMPFGALSRRDPALGAPAALADYDRALDRLNPRDRRSVRLDLRTGDAHSLTLDAK